MLALPGAPPTLFELLLPKRPAVEGSAFDGFYRFVY